MTKVSNFSIHLLAIHSLYSIRKYLEQNKQIVKNRFQAKYYVTLVMNKNNHERNSDAFQYLKWSDKDLGTRVINEGGLICNIFSSIITT